MVSKWNPALIALAASFALLAASPAARAGEWESIAKADRVELFVNPTTVTSVGDKVGVRVKENWVDAQPSTAKGKTYQSARSEYRVDCAQRKVGKQSVQLYSGADLTGTVIKKLKYAEKNVSYVNATDGTVYGELVNYACKAR
jgi:hypothetical protein